MSTPKLPIMPTVRRAYAATREQIHLLVQISRRLGIAAGIGLVAGVLLVRAMPPDQFPLTERASALTALPALVLALGAYVIIVRWHRLLIQDLTVAQTARGSVGSAVLYFARVSFLVALGVAIAMVGSLLPVTLTSDLIAGDARWYLAITVTALAVTAALALLARLSLILPAGAVKDYSVTLKNSWSLTRGNTLRMLAGSALASGPAIVTNVVANAAMSASETATKDAGAIAALTILSLTLAIVAGVIQAGFLSYAYLFFTGSERPRSG